MNADRKALRDAFLAECWAPCRELPLHERVEKRQADRSVQRQVEDMSTGLGGQRVEVQWDAS